MANSETTNAISVLKTDVAAFVQAGKRLPDKAPAQPTVVTGIEKLEASKLKQFEAFWTEAAASKKGERNRRKILYMLAGPCPALIGAAIIAGGPITLPAAAIAFGSFATVYLARKTVAAINAFAREDAAQDFTVKQTTKALTTVEKWIEKKTLSKVSDSARDACEAWQTYDQLDKKPITRCEDAVRLLEAAYRAQHATAAVAPDFKLIDKFAVFSLATFNDLYEKCQKQTIEEKLAALDKFVDGDEHSKCVNALHIGTCYKREANGRPRSPKFQTPKAFTGDMLKMRDPFTRLMNDAAIRVLKQGKKESALKPGIVLSYPDLRKETERLLAGLKVPKTELQALDKTQDTAPTVEDECVEKMSTTVGKAAPGQVSAAALKTAEIVSLQDVTIPYFEGAFNASSLLAFTAHDANLLVAPLGIAVGIGKAIGDSVYVKKELEALQKELAKKELSERDESVMLKALRAALKDGHYFSQLAEQLVKTQNIIEKTLKETGEAFTKTPSCETAFDLMVCILRVAKHREKVLARLPFLMTFAQIIRNLIARSDDKGETWKKEMAALDAKLEAFFPKHPHGPCGGWCYNGSTVKVMGGYMTVVSSKGGVESKEELDAVDAEA